jgi:hypothetical protein
MSSSVRIAGVASHEWMIHALDGAMPLRYILSKLGF